MDNLNRRNLLKFAALAGTALAAPAFLRAQSPNNKLNIAVIGAGGKGSSDTDHCAGENIYALCDESGKTIGTGTREVCEVLLYIITRSNQLGTRPPVRPTVRTNVRAAISIG